MVFASSYPLLDVFWTMLWFFLFFIWIWLLITVFVDLFRSHDLSGWGKAGWADLRDYPAPAGRPLLPHLPRREHAEAAGAGRSEPGATVP